MDFLAELSGLVDFPIDILTSYRYTVLGGKAAYIAGYSGIKHFDSTLIELKAGKQIISITGTDLVINRMSGNDMLIMGEISAVSVN